MRSLATLIKLQKSRVDEQRLLVAKLQEQLAKIESDIARLHQDMAAQKKLVSQDPSCGLTYGSYIARTLAQDALLAKKRRTAVLAVDIALDKLAEIFEEQKRYEIAEEDRIKAEHKEELRLERIALDEVGSVRFARKQKIKPRK